MIEDLFFLAWKGLTHRKIRSFLTVISIVIGICAIVTLTAVSKGFEASISAILEQFGADTILIVPGKSLGTLMAGFVAAPLTDRDVDVVLRVPGVKDAAGIAAKTMIIRVGHKKVPLTVFGYEAEKFAEYYGKVTETYMESGRIFRKGDKYVAIIGNDVAHKIFDTDITPGRSIYINDKRFRVIGVLLPAGNQQDNLSVSIPIEAFKELLGGDELTYWAIMAKAAPGTDITTLAEKIKKKLKQARGAEDFQVTTSEDLLNQINSILGTISAIVIAVAAISLIVGGVGIMNTMYMSVMERTREIGVMKAVGAQRWQIRTIFLIEAGLIGLLGAIAGDLLAIVLVKVIENAIRTSLGIMYYSAYIPPGVLLGAAVLGFFIGVISGYLPARRAARLNPVEALRYE